MSKFRPLHRLSANCRCSVVLLSLAAALQSTGVEARLLPLGERFRVNAHTTEDYIGGRNVALDDGGFVILWQGPPFDGFFFSHYGRVFDGSGAPRGSDFTFENVFSPTPPVAALRSSLVLAFAGDHRYEVGTFGLDGTLGQLLPADDAAGAIDISVTATAGQEVIVTWSDYDAIYAQRFTPDGRAAGPPFVVDDAIDELPHDPRVAAAPDGSFVVVWWAELVAAIWARGYDENDNPLGARFAVVEPYGVGDSGSREICVHQDSGTFAVTWHDFGVGAEFRRLSATTTTAPRLCSGVGGIAADLACGPDGSLMIAGVAAHLGRSFIALRAFDGQNRITGTAVFEVPRPTRRILFPSISVLANHSFVTSWTECAIEPGRECDIFAQRFMLSDEPDCAGDCDGDGQVTIDELLVAVDLALIGEANVARCQSIDGDADCKVSVSETLTAIGSALRGCT